MQEGPAPARRVTRGADRLNATQLLKRDHNAVKRLFAEFRRAPARAHRKRRGLAARIMADLAIHSRIEEDMFYPALTTVAGAAAALAEARADHEAVTTLIEETSTAEAPEAELVERIEELRDIFIAHATEEEDDLFPLAATLGDDALSRLGRELAARKHALATRRAPTSPRPTAA